MAIASSAPSARLPRLRLGLPLLAGLLTLTTTFGIFYGGAATLRVDEGVRLRGHLTADAPITTVTLPRGGKIGRLHVSVGQLVVAGQSLASLDTTAIDARISELQAEAVAAARQLEQLRIDARALTDVADGAPSSRSDVLTLESQAIEIQDEVQSLKQRIEQAERDLVRAEIRAPVGGRITRLAAAGAVAAIVPGEPLAEITRLESGIAVEGPIDAGDLRHIRHGMDARVWLIDRSRPWERFLAARLVWISPDQVDNRATGIGQFPARLELIGVDAELIAALALRPGQRADVLIRTGDRSLLERLFAPALNLLARSSIAAPIRKPQEPS